MGRSNRQGKQLAGIMHTGHPFCICDGTQSDAQGHHSLSRSFDNEIVTVSPWMLGMILSWQTQRQLPRIQTTIQIFYRHPIATRSHSQKPRSSRCNSMINFANLNCSGASSRRRTKARNHGQAGFAFDPGTKLLTCLQHTCPMSRRYQTMFCKSS